MDDRDNALEVLKVHEGKTISTISLQTGTTDAKTEYVRYDFTDGTFMLWNMRCSTRE